MKKSSTARIRHFQFFNHFVNLCSKTILIFWAQPASKNYSRVWQFFDHEWFMVVKGKTLLTYSCNLDNCHSWKEGFYNHEWHFLEIMSSFFSRVSLVKWQEFEDCLINKSLIIHSCTRDLISLFVLTNFYIYFFNSDCSKFENSIISLVQSCKKEFKAMSKGLKRIDA